jgi:hypothetical protein
MKKYADTESVEIVDKPELQRIEAGVHRLGKTSVAELDPDERLRVLTDLHLREQQ